jgi:hypothetical protein
MPVSMNNTQVVFNDTTAQTTAGVTSIVAGTGISSSGGLTPTIANTGVTSIVAGTGITISGGTGAVTVNASGSGVTSLNGQTGAITNTNTDVIGSYVYAVHTAASSVSYGATVAGGNIKPISLGTTINSGAAVANTRWSITADTLSGTWRCMGFAEYDTSVTVRYGVTLFVRVS